MADESSQNKVTVLFPNPNMVLLYLCLYVNPKSINAGLSFIVIQSKTLKTTSLKNGSPLEKFI